MRTVENSRIKVTLNNETYNKYLTGDRVEILPSGDKRIHFGADETRGKILSDAMRALAHRQVVKRDPELDLESARQSVMDDYVYDFLAENTRYNLADLMRRITDGHRLSAGQQSEYSNAIAYATGKMGGITIGDIAALGTQIMDSKKPEDRREWNRLTLMSDCNTVPAVDVKIIEIAKNDESRKKDYSNNFIFSDLEIEILTPDNMPEQIGAQDYDSDK